jgi:ubiquinone/menaquinone biosynthesis C-methylase UbiE
MSYSSENYQKHIYPSSAYQFLIARFFRKFYYLFSQVNVSSVLEVGCGEGFVLDYLAKRNPDLRLSGIDQNPAAVRMAARITARGITYACADGQHIPYPDGAFEMVVISEVLEHVHADPTDILREAMRVSRRFLLITVPREPYFQTITDCLLACRVIDDPEHINFWTKRQLQQWLRQHLSILRYTTRDLYQLALCEKHEINTHHCLAKGIQALQYKYVSPSAMSSQV